MSHVSSRSFAVVGPVLAALTLAGCQDSTENAPITTTSPAGQATAPPAAVAERADNALVRFVHAVPAGAAVDLYADDNPTFTDVAFKSVTPYREVDGERYTFRLRSGGMARSQPLATNSEGLDDGEYYTVFALPGDDEAAMLRVVEDDFSRVSDGKARVRVVHGARDLDEIDVFAAGRDDELFDGVDFQTVTDYEEVDPWTGALQIRAENESSTLASLPNVTLEAGKVYTVVVTGAIPRAPKLKGAPTLEAFVIEDKIGDVTVQ